VKVGQALRWIPGILLAAGCVIAQSAMAQAPPGPQSAPPPAQGGPPAPGIQKVVAAKPRQTILGAWKLNKDESDNPRDRMRQSRDNRNGGYGGRRGGGYPGGGGRGPYGGRGESDEDRARTYELMDPARQIKLAMTGAEVDLFDNLDRKRAFMTDGRKLQKSKDTSYEEIAAHWDGNRLVTDEKDSRGNKVSRTFELSENGLQLYEKIHMTMGRYGSVVAFEFVYDAHDSDTAATPSGRPN
jgi:hypothetical protein